MTDNVTPLRKIWLERARAGFLMAGHLCVRGVGHKIVENKTDTGMAMYCSKCKAGLAIKRPRGEIVRDVVTENSDLRQCCWMCGNHFTNPRTKDEYIEQLCATCLVALDAAKVLRIDDPRTKEVGGRPPASAHLKM